MTDRTYFQPSEWGLSNRLTTNHIWDGFIILSLMEDAVACSRLLRVPHTGSQADRFKLAMEERNNRIILNGQPDAVRHACDRCMRIFLMPDGNFGESSPKKKPDIMLTPLSSAKCQAIVGDGLSIGRPCCGVFRCRDPLENNRHRFCAKHTNLHNVCAIVNCENPVVHMTIEDPRGGPSKVVKKKACSLALHQEIEKKNSDRSTGSFLYKQRLQHAQISQPVDSLSTSHHVPEQDIQEDIELYSADKDGVRVHIEKNPGTIGVVDDSQEICPSKAATGNRTVKAQFGRRRMHNEQTLVRPCGVIFARATMFGAEAVSNFLVMLKNAFSVPGAQKPEHIFYDTNCDARQQAEKDPWFQGIGMCVDAWHFRKKHAVTHKYCQLNCNPAKYPELMDGSSGWFFNTSVAEQTNAWLGGYHSMCREMLPAKFDFFLDEMIRLRNIEIIRKLQENGHHPRNY